MKKLSFVELCAGLGGTRAGLDAAGWTCNLALDNDPDAVVAHRLAFGTCDYADVRKMDPYGIPKHDLLVSGFPCQPFSSSGSKTGFEHEKGLVFDAVANVADKLQPRIVLLENVTGILSNAYGHTFASILQRLTKIGYMVAWGVLNSAWFGIPQERQRVFIIGTRSAPDRSFCLEQCNEKLLLEVGLAGMVISEYLTPVGLPIELGISQIIVEREPRMGLRRPNPQTPFGRVGIAVEDKVWTWNGAIPKFSVKAESLGEIVCPDFKLKNEVRSVRYWGHSGTTLPYFKREPLAHCVGTNIGAGPTFGIIKSALVTPGSRDLVLKYANWFREEPNHLVFRLTPSRAALLFGPHMMSLQRAIDKVPIGVTKKYELLGNLVAPEVVRNIGQQLARAKNDG